jgi:hypothetical protein
MILSIIAIVLVAGIAYFHWVQGLFSSAISMALALLASAMAIGMHEWVATSLLGGAMADYANGAMAAVIFAAVYGIGRIFFDMFVPGNVSVPFYMDKVGAGACGLIAGIFSVGTIMLAAQMLPFGVAIAGFTRYPIADTKEVNAPGRRGQMDAEVVGALEIEQTASKPSETARQSLILPVDSMVLNFATFQSATGALAGDVELTARHPNLLDELFFARVGIENGAKRTALNISGKNDVTVSKLLAAPTLAQVDAEIKEMRHPNFSLDKSIKAGPNNVLLIVRMKIAANATDKDKNFRVSAGAVRLVVGGEDHYPLGTLYQPGNVLMANRIDDYIIINAGSDADVEFVFSVPRASLLEDPAAKDGLKAKADAFVEVKRYARVDIGGMDIATAIDSPTSTSVVHKTKIVEEISKRLGDGTP